MAHCIFVRSCLACQGVRTYAGIVCQNRCQRMSEYVNVCMHNMYVCVYQELCKNSLSGLGSLEEYVMFNLQPRHQTDYQHLKHLVRGAMRCYPTEDTHLGQESFSEGEILKTDNKPKHLLWPCCNLVPCIYFINHHWCWHFLVNPNERFSFQ